MSERRFMRRAFVALLCSAAAILAGCKTNEGHQAKVARKAVTSLDNTRQELVKADQEVNQTLAAMDQLAAQPRDLKQSYRAFTTEVSDVTEQSEESRKRADEMRERWQDYITNWEREADRISSPELRAGAAERRQTVRENYDGLRNAARDTQAAYDPFVKQLRDIERALSLDLTPAGVDAAKPAMETARQTGAQLQEQINAFITELDRVSSKTAAQPVAGSQ